VATFNLMKKIQRNLREDRGGGLLRNRDLPTDDAGALETVGGAAVVIGKKLNLGGTRQKLRVDFCSRKGGKKVDKP